MLIFEQTLHGFRPLFHPMHSSMIPDGQSARIAPLECPPSIIFEVVYASAYKPWGPQTFRDLFEIETLVVSRFLLVVG